MHLTNCYHFVCGYKIHIPGSRLQAKDYLILQQLPRIFLSSNSVYIQAGKKVRILRSNPEQYRLVLRTAAA